MIPFSSRTKGYKTGVFLLFFAAILFVVGFGAPYWFTADFIYDKSHSGLWESCSTKCSTFRTKELPGWFHAVRGFEVLCIIGLTSACIYALITNFCLSFPGPRSRALEIMAGVSGILGFIGCMVFVGKYDTLNKDYDWAFYFATVGSDLVVIAAIVIGVNNKPMPNRGLMVTTTATAQPQPYTVQPGNYPPQSYVAQPGNYPPPRSVDQPGNYPPPHSVDQPGNYPPPHSVDQPSNYPPPHSVDQPSNYPPPHSVDQP